MLGIILLDGIALRILSQRYLVHSPDKDGPIKLRVSKYYEIIHEIDE